MGGLLLVQMALMGYSFGGTFLKDRCFYPYFSFKVGDGSTIFFWHDRWCEGGPLKDLFPSLYALAENKDESVVDYREQVFGSFVWAPIFTRDAFVDDLTLVSFLSILHGISILDCSHDSVRWKYGIFCLRGSSLLSLTIRSSSF